MAAIKLPVPVTNPRMVRPIFRSIPVVSITPPNIMADMMSQTVSSMLAIPPRDSRSSSAPFPEWSSNPPYIAIQNP